MAVGKYLVEGIDGASGAQYINTALYTAKPNLRTNAEITEKGTINVEDGKYINTGTEILMPYGPKFWRGVKAAAEWEKNNPNILKSNGGKATPAPDEPKPDTTNNPHNAITETHTNQPIVEPTDPHTTQTKKEHETAPNKEDEINPEINGERTPQKVRQTKTKRNEILRRQSK